MCNMMILAGRPRDGIVLSICGRFLPLVPADKIPVAEVASEPHSVVLIEEAFIDSAFSEIFLHTSVSPSYLCAIHHDQSGTCIASSGVYKVR